MLIRHSEVPGPSVRVCQAAGTEGLRPLELGGASSTVPVQVMLHGGIQGRALLCGAVGWAGRREKEGGKMKETTPTNHCY